MGDTKIEWVAGEDGTPGKSWNPIRGCTRVSAGCKHCYAERMATRFSQPGMPFYGIAQMQAGEPHWTGNIEILPKELERPRHWRKPCRIFVCSMSDLFHEALGTDVIQAVIDTIQRAPQHTYILLTKRAERMAAVLPHLRLLGGKKWQDRPPSNVWVGVSTENQEMADARIPLLLDTPAALHWVSYEPALGPVDFTPWLYGAPKVELIVVGGES